MRSETSTGWLVRFASLTLATMVFLVNPIDGGEFEVVSPSPWADVEAPSGGLHGGPPNGARLQQVLAAEDFMSLPAGNQVLTAISWRSDGEGEGEGTLTYANMLIRISTTEKAVGELSTTYTQNWGFDLTTVWEGDLVRSFTHTGPVGGPKEFDTPTQLQTPFVYDPNAGNLLIDFLYGPLQIDGNVSFDFLDDTNQSYMQYIWSGPNSSTADYNTGGLIWQFTFVPEPSTLMLAAIGLVGLISGVVRMRHS